MAFRCNKLREIGGFDPRFRIAGDDVDICWRLQGRGWTIGYNRAAFVWHLRSRGSITPREKPRKVQQDWPFKLAGRVYPETLAFPLSNLDRIYHGMWGSAPF